MKTIGLIACCSRKLQYAAPAHRLYCSTLFCWSRRWIERHCDSWGILSAKYGLVLPETLIAPYDKTLSRMTLEERDAWYYSTRLQIDQAFPESSFIVMAGALYKQVLDGLNYTDPLNGLGLGKRLAWLRKELSCTP